MNLRLLIILFLVFFSGCILKSEEERRAEALEEYFEKKAGEIANSETESKPNTVESKGPKPSEDQRCKELCKVAQTYQVSPDSLQGVMTDSMNPNCFCEVVHTSRRFGSRIPIVKDFMRRKTNSWHEMETPLHIVLMQENIPAARTLLESGSWVNDPVGPMGVPLNVALYKNSVGEMDLLDGFGADPSLVDLGYARNEKSVNRYLRQGANPENINVNFAIRKRDLRMVKRLMEAGAKPKKIDHHYLIRFCKIDMLQVLLENGMDPDVENNIGGGSLLLEAIEARKADKIDLLLEAGADPNLEGDFAKLPLHSVIQHSNAEVFDKLIAHKAKVNPVPVDDFFFKNLMETAIDEGDSAIVEKMQNLGAKVSKKHKSNYNYGVSVEADSTILTILK